eukprot:TCALIF_05132-PA protein Name:"Similar to folt-1 Folate transporter 1 (Caenorhabditis elegans)" AED:0.03 eAED:0.07 QI:0/0/0/1/0.5/0.33/3/0/244
MEGWKAITSLLCLYGFLKELRPSEPFLTEYLINPKWSNITLEQAYYDVYPVWTYSYLAVLILVFLLTDLLRYKPVIVVEGFAYIGTWILLLYGKGVPTMQVRLPSRALTKIFSFQLMQFVYGVATSTEVAYYSYIYTKVNQQHFQAVTSWTRVALLLGRFLSGCLAQILTSSGLCDYRGLNFVSLASVSLATVVSFFLPKVTKTIYFHHDDFSPVNSPENEALEGNVKLLGFALSQNLFLTDFE